ncbi:MAG: outer membrane beta-barrel protein [Candidatus Eisenbacteria sp.]|nr:outer membrane beta-barrel protein [Candidatus Eisenbacteria bacterium]
MSLGTLPAAGEIGLQAIEGRIGFVDLEAPGGSTFMISAGADLGQLSPDLGLEAGIDFWTKGLDEGSDGYGGCNCTWDYSWSTIAFIGNVRYDIQTEGSFAPFLFGGLGFHFWKADADVDCSGCGVEWVDEGYSHSDLEIGFNFGAGADIGSGEGMMPTFRAGFNSNGGFDYLYIQGGLKFPVGQ